MNEAAADVIRRYLSSEISFDDAESLFQGEGGTAEEFSNLLPLEVLTSAFVSVPDRADERYDPRRHGLRVGTIFHLIKYQANSEIPYVRAFFAELDFD